MPTFPIALSFFYEDTQFPGKKGVLKKILTAKLRLLRLRLEGGEWGAAGHSGKREKRKKIPFFAAGKFGILENGSSGLNDVCLCKKKTSLIQIRHFFLWYCTYFLPCAKSKLVQLFELFFASKLAMLSSVGSLATHSKEREGEREKKFIKFFERFFQRISPPPFCAFEVREKKWVHWCGFDWKEVLCTRGAKTFHALKWNFKARL